MKPKSLGAAVSNLLELPNIMTGHDRSLGDWLGTKQQFDSTQVRPFFHSDSVVSAMDCVDHRQDARPHGFGQLGPCRYDCCQVRVFLLQNTKENTKPVFRIVVNPCQQSSYEFNATAF